MPIIERCARHPEAHTDTCYCGNPATVHIAYDSGCGNTCAKHAAGIKRVKPYATTAAPVNRQVKGKRTRMTTVTAHDNNLTPLERDALHTLLAAIVNDDDGFDTYGLSTQEKAAVRRGLAKLGKGLT